VSATVVGVTLSNYVTNFRWPDEFQSWLGFVFPFVILGFAVFALLKTRQNVLLIPYGAIMSMQAAYMANCLLCLSSFFGQWQIGAYCSLVTVIAYVTQLIWVWRNHATQAETSPVWFGLDEGPNRSEQTTSMFAVGSDLATSSEMCNASIAFRCAQQTRLRGKRFGGQAAR
jgi:hypothetical protein